jgi:hypothetical protein
VASLIDHRLRVAVQRNAAAQQATLPRRRHERTDCE